MAEIDHQHYMRKYEEYQKQDPKHNVLSYSDWFNKVVKPQRETKDKLISREEIAKVAGLLKVIDMHRSPFYDKVAMVINKEPTWEEKKVVEKVFKALEVIRTLGERQKSKLLRELVGM